MVTKGPDQILFRKHAFYIIVIVCYFVCMCYCLLYVLLFIVCAIILFVGDDASEEELSDKARMMMYIQYLHTYICTLIVDSNPI